MKNARETKIFILILILFSLYAGIFIYRTSFEIAGQRIFTLFDDEMISMRYAKNLADGHGLVWNPGGERVEGYTNPLWVLYMAFIHKFPLDVNHTSLVVQLTGYIVLLINLYVVRKIALLISGHSFGVAIASVLLTAFYYPLIYWGLVGTEVCILTLIMSIAVWKILLYLNSGKILTGVYFLLGISTLIRIDMVVPFIGMWVFLLVVMPSQRKKNILWGFIVLMLFLGGQTLFRLLYYGDMLPNTFYLKMTGFPWYLRIWRGMIVFLDFLVHMNPLLFLIPFLGLFFRTTKAQVFLVWTIIVQISYSIYVGGDAWEKGIVSNRFISIVMPIFFIQFASVLSHLIEKATSTVYHSLSQQSLKKVHRSIFTLIIAISLIHFNSFSLGEEIFLDVPYQKNFNQEMVERALIIKYLTKPTAHIAVTWAGAMPYFSDRFSIDVLGKCDRVIAHKKASVPEKIADFTPGHMKWDYDYTYGELKPDIIPLLWGGGREKAWPYISKYYSNISVYGENSTYTFWIRNNSPEILWDKLSNK